MKLNFVLCPSYSGASILSVLLANHSKITALADTVPARNYDWICACGKRQSQCEFWQKISKKLNTNRFNNCSHLLPYYPLLLSNKKRNMFFNKVLQLSSLYMGPWIWKFTGKASREYLQIYLDFYKITCDMQNTSVLIDGQKSIHRVLLAKGLIGKNAQINVLHLVRDPRGSFNSAKKRRKRNEKLTPEQHAKCWLRYHNFARKLQRNFFGVSYYRLRYEDFCQEPVNTMARIFEFFGVDNEDVLRPTTNPDKHHQIGNRVLKKKFDGNIRADTAWKNNLSREEQIKLIKLTEPLATMWGYAVNEVRLSK